MSISGELRFVPAISVPAMVERATQGDVAKRVMASEGASLDKVWNGLSYLLIGLCDEDPLGGRWLYGVATAYGPPRLHVPIEVERCALALAGIDERSLRAAYDPVAMTRAEVYPNIWDRESEREGNLGWLLDGFRRVRGFYQEAARRGDGVLYFLA